MYRIMFFALLALVIGVGGAFAESVLGDDEGGTTATITAAGTGGSSSSSDSGGDGGEATESGFDSLSPGNRKIAEALFQGQSDGGEGDSATGWTRDDIALAKQDGQGWGQIFKQMKEDGLVDARNLGQLVSRHNRTLNGSLNKGPGAAESEPSLDDIADGDTTGTSSGGDGGGTAPASGSADGGGAEPGTYKELSPGGRKIADALFDAQKPVEGSGDVWSVDQIAAAKQDGQGWGEIFRQMKQDQLFQERNLGQLVSGHGKIDVATATGGGAGLLVTDGGGRQRSVGGVKSGGKASVGKSGTGGTRGGKYNISTAGGSRGGSAGVTRTGGWHGRGVVTAGGNSVGGQSASLGGGGKSGSARGRIK